MEVKTTKQASNEASKANVSVGRDVIENVDYLVFNRDKWFSNEAVGAKPSLKNTWDDFIIILRKYKFKIKDFYWKIKYGFQRMFKDYDNLDIFNTFDKFIERYTKILTRLKNCHHGYPGDLTEEEWTDILNDMLYHLKYMDEITVSSELEKDVPDDWMVDAKIVYEIMEKHKEEFFKLFSKYFYSLWD